MYVSFCLKLFEIGVYLVISSILKKRKKLSVSHQHDGKKYNFGQNIQKNDGRKTHIALDPIDLILN